MWTNALHKWRKSPTRGRHYAIPGYDLYNAGFGICDRLNRSLRQRCFPYRCGSIQKGDSAGSDLKRFFDFILSNVLRNTFKMFEFLTKTDEGNHKLSFSSHCILLAEELFDSTQK